MDTALLQKYNVPGPRYTSYPTVPYWNKTAPTASEWLQTVSDTFAATNSTDGISLYVHLPFCESLCTYCGCNTRITVNHRVEEPYIYAVLTEWAMYRSHFSETPKIRELHLGGGTPTFFSAENLRRLIEGLLAGSEIHEKACFSFEAHPGNTTDEHLQTLYELGFRRVSVGVQDTNPLVLELINRHQTYEQVEHLMLKAREIGYTSVNIDMVYGLPQQRVCSMTQTIMHITNLKPDRLALYSYAHVPWVKPGQRRFSEQDLPDASKKLAIYETCRNWLELSGYQEIGMDHFALATDSLSEAEKSGKLHRNFMGYTDTPTKLLIGLGASSISDSWGAYVQNAKSVEAYYERLRDGQFPFFKGHLLTEDDLVIRKHILNLMCRFETSWMDKEMQSEGLYEGLHRIEELEADGLIEVEPYRLRVTPKGRSFVRNVCMAFDARLWENLPETTLFSQTV